MGKRSYGDRLKDFEMIDGRLESVPYTAYAKLKKVADGLSEELSREQSKVSLLEKEIEELKEKVLSLEIQLISEQSKKEVEYEDYVYTSSDKTSDTIDTMFKEPKGKKSGKRDKKP